VEAERLYKAYGRRVAVADISFRVSRRPADRGF